MILAWWSPIPVAGNVSPRYEVLRTVIEIPASIRPLFLNAGWRPGRRVAISRDIPIEHPAAAVLSEYGGLRVGQSGQGRECAASDVVFQALTSGPTIRGWSELLGSMLVGVAAVQDSDGELYVDSSGQWFERALVDDGFLFTGKSFGETMERLLLGLRCRPVLRPDQKEVTVYGEIVTADDLRVYRYR
jgi:hypothetical protein